MRKTKKESDSTTVEAAEFRERRAPEKNSVPDRRKSRSLAQILLKNRTISAWLVSRKKRKTDALITLVDGLGEEDREALLNMTHLVIDVRDDLVEIVARLKEENGRLHSLTLTDPLTGLYNTRFFVMQLEIEMARTRRTGQQSSLMMIDLDNFKSLNDSLGHIAGNRFLVKAAAAIRENLRPTDIVCRYGGDEFAVIMPATDLFDAVRIANRMREAIPLVLTRARSVVSASIGVAEYSPASTYGGDQFVHIADMALYKAKKQGKNQVFFQGKAEKSADVIAVTQEEKDALAKMYD